MYQNQRGGANVNWIDVSRCNDADLGTGLTREQAMARLYLRKKDGSLVSGAEAFTSLWKQLPRWAWLGHLLGTAATLWLLEAGYRGFLVARRSWRPLATAAICSARTLPKEVVTDLRTDHAGETGAVCIYQGILCITRDPVLLAFAQKHKATEEKHLSIIEAWLPPADRSRLLPLWRLAGWLTGAVPALFGPRAVYATIEAVETFVDEHYEAQIQRLEKNPSLHSLRRVLLECQGDEVSHREEAAAAKQAIAPNKPSIVLSLWCKLVDAGSRGAVTTCKYV